MDKMYYLGKLSKEKIYYTLKIGFAIAKRNKTADETIFIDSKLLYKFKNYSKDDNHKDLNSLIS